MLDLEAVVNSITIPGFTLRLEDQGFRQYVHIEQQQPDSSDPAKVWLYGEPIAVQNDWTTADVVVAIYCAYQFLMIHEGSEGFKVNGQAVFNQHLCPETIRNTRILLQEERLLLWPVDHEPVEC